MSHNNQNQFKTNQPNTNQQSLPKTNTTSNRYQPQPKPEYTPYNSQTHVQAPKIIVEPVQTVYGGKRIEQLPPTREVSNQGQYVPYGCAPCNQNQCFTSHQQNFKETIVKINPKVMSNDNVKIKELESQIQNLLHDQQNQAEINELKNTITLLSNEIKSIQPVLVPPPLSMPTQVIQVPIDDGRILQLEKKIFKLKQKKKCLKQEVFKLRVDLENLLRNLEQKDMHVNGCENELRNISVYLQNVCKSLNDKLQLEISQKNKLFQTVQDLEKILAEEISKRDQNLIIMERLRTELIHINPLVSQKDQEIHDLVGRCRSLEAENIQLSNLLSDKNQSKDQLVILNQITRQREEQIAVGQTQYNSLIQQFEQLQAQKLILQQDNAQQAQQIQILQQQLNQRNVQFQNLESQLGQVQQVQNTEQLLLQRLAALEQLLNQRVVGPQIIAGPRLH